MSEDMPPILPAKTDGEVPANVEQVSRIDKLIESKEKQTGFSWDNSLMYAPLSGYAALQLQSLVAPTIKGGHLKENLAKNPAFQSSLSKASTVAEKEAIIAKTVEHSINEGAKAGLGGRIARSQVNNAGAWKVGMVAATVGSILGWEKISNKWRTDEVKKEITDLKEMKKTWVERISEPADAAKDNVPRFPNG